MLDKPLYEEEENLKPLQCEECKLYFGQAIEWQHIDDFGVCRHCYSQLIK